MTRVNWKTEAEKIPSDYQRGNHREGMLKNHLAECHPEMLADLESRGELESFLQVMVAESLETELELTEQGMDPFEARGVALEAMMPAAESDRQKTYLWEREGQAEADGAAIQRMFASPGKRNQPLT